MQCGRSCAVHASKEDGLDDLMKAANQACEKYDNAAKELNKKVGSRSKAVK